MFASVFSQNKYWQCPTPYFIYYVPYVLHLCSAFGPSALKSSTLFRPWSKFRVRTHFRKSSKLELLYPINFILTNKISHSFSQSIYLSGTLLQSFFRNLMCFPNKQIYNFYYVKLNRFFWSIMFGIKYTIYEIKVVKGY